MKTVVILLSAAALPDVEKMPDLAECLEHLTLEEYIGGSPRIIALMIAAGERAAIVAFLRSGAAKNPECGRARFAAALGDAIERGDHHATKTETGGDA